MLSEALQMRTSLFECGFNWQTTRKKENTESLFRMAVDSVWGWWSQAGLGLILTKVSWPFFAVPSLKGEVP